MDNQEYDFLIWGSLMILWEWYKGRVYTKGKSEGMSAGIIEQQQKWEEWNTRRCKAEAEGTKFDEPPPHAEYGSSLDESTHRNKN